MAAKFMSFFTSTAKNENYTEAFLGDDKEMYYNEQLKKWVAKNEENQVDHDTLPSSTSMPSAPPMASTSPSTVVKLTRKQKNATHLYTNTPGISLKEAGEKNESIYLTPSYIKNTSPLYGSNDPFDHGSSNSLSVSPNFIPQTPFNAKHLPSSQSGLIDNKLLKHAADHISNDESPNKCLFDGDDYEDLKMCSDFPIQSNTALSSSESHCQLLSNVSVFPNEIDNFDSKSPVVARDKSPLSQSRKSTVHRQLTIQSRSTSIAHGSGVPIYDVSNEEYEKFKELHIHNDQNDKYSVNDVNDDGKDSFTKSLVESFNASLGLNSNLLDTTINDLNKCMNILEKIKSTNLTDVFTEIDKKDVYDKIMKQNDHLVEVIQKMYSLFDNMHASKSLDSQPPSKYFDNKSILSINSKLVDLLNILNNYQNKIFSICNKINTGGDFNSVKLDITHVESLLNKLQMAKNKLSDSLGS